MNLPDIELVSAAVHSAWMDSKRAQGVSSRKAEDGEELMAPYEVLSEKAKELDRGTVKAVYAAIEKASAAGATATSSNPCSTVPVSSGRDEQTKVGVEPTEGER